MSKKAWLICGLLMVVLLVITYMAWGRDTPAIEPVDAQPVSMSIA